jgi:precorrin-4/cobalt-precorrin-4 C11-methyltransferase
MTVYFIGAGPGDPELITVKGQRLINASPIILYAGSLVPRAILAEVENSAEKIIDTASIDLDQIIEHMNVAHKEGKDVARVHSGDPSSTSKSFLVSRQRRPRLLGWVKS